MRLTEVYVRKLLFLLKLLPFVVRSSYENIDGLSFCAVPCFLLLVK